MSQSSQKQAVKPRTPPGGVQVHQPDVTTYPALLREVKRVLRDGESLINETKLRSCWETGFYIKTHIFLNKDRADIYGSEVVEHLSRDLGDSTTFLYRCMKFVEKYPDQKILATWPECSWSHFRELISISDDAERLRFEKMVSKGGLSVKELHARKMAARPPAEEAETASPESSAGLVDRSLLTPQRGQLYTYQILKRKVIAAGMPDDLVVDLGFSIVHNVEPKLLSSFSAGDIVESRPKEDAYRFVKSGRTAKDLYTYNALVERVVDGDTLKVHIDLGFDTWVRQTLRLRGIDCPEVGTKEGDAAKAFVQSLLKEADTIVIRSSRSDKYDRYLADVFIPSPDGDVFLNNLLLEKSMAVRMG